MKLLIIGATHGNELLGTKLYGRLLQQRSPLLEHIDFIIGNPRAYTAKTRYTDCDLNRSYGVDGDGYEIARAKQIQDYIASTKPDLVIDMHTTTGEQVDCIIVGSMEGDMKQRFLRACHINTILQVASLTDIATLGDFVVAYEVPAHHITNQLLDRIAADLQRFTSGTGGHSAKRLFRMSGKIYKDDVTEAEAATFVNFEMHPLGFVPILTGETSYKKQTDYLGFKSPEPEEIKV